MGLERIKIATSLPVAGMCQSLLWKVESGTVIRLAGAVLMPELGTPEVVLSGEGSDTIVTQ